MLDLDEDPDEVDVAGEGGADDIAVAGTPALIPVGGVVAPELVRLGEVVEGVDVASQADGGMADPGVDRQARRPAPGCCRRSPGR